MKAAKKATKQKQEAVPEVEDFLFAMYSGLLHGSSIVEQLRDLNTETVGLTWGDETAKRLTPLCDAMTALNAAFVAAHVQVMKLPEFQQINHRVNLNAVRRLRAEGFAVADPQGLLSPKQAIANVVSQRAR